jgi:GTP cyclohydrolase II
MYDLNAILGAPDRLIVERAIGEFRKGRPVLLYAGDGSRKLAAPTDGLLQDRFAALAMLGVGRLSLAMTGRRFEWLKQMAVEQDIMLVSLDPTADADVIAELSAGDFSTDLQSILENSETSEGGPLPHAAVELARLAHLAPCAVLVDVDPKRLAAIESLLVVVPVDAVEAYRRGVADELRIVAEAHVPLSPNIPTRFVVFRGGNALHDQVAIMIGTPDPRDIVPVRLHSACLTGDLFGSLKCDCGDQLRMTVERFQEEGGGILLYLDQEGRGIGIANKMRAYYRQANGSDTIDADAALGFRDDERDYDEAARMLGVLGYRRVVLYSNNPRKAEALLAGGIDVVAHEKVATPVTRQNAAYLKTKAKRAGHLIDSDWVDEVARSLVAQAGE